MRFYALLCTLVFGRVPYRVATVFLQSMEWQAEDATESLGLMPRGHESGGRRLRAE